MITSSVNDVTGDFLSELYSTYFEKSPINRQITASSIRNHVYLILMNTLRVNDVTDHVKSDKVLKLILGK